MRVRSRVLLIASLVLLLLIGLVNLSSAQEGDVENGRELFGEYCAVCHGYDGQGRVGADLTGWFASIDPGSFVKSTISEGVAETMPAFAQDQGGPLSEDEINDVAAYILSWRERVEPAPTPTPIPITPIPAVAGVTGDPTAGAQLYFRECQVCHGEKGEGGVGATLSDPIAASQPAAFLRQVVNNGVQGSSMPAFRTVLSDAEVENVIAYILSWEREPLPPATPEADEEGEFNWLFALLFLFVALGVGVWLIARFSQRDKVDVRQIE